MSVVRVRSEGPWVVTDPDGILVTLRPGAAYPREHPLVRTYPWAFESDVEQATAAPGERRNVAR